MAVILPRERDRINPQYEFDSSRLVLCINKQIPHLIVKPQDHLCMVYNPVKVLLSMSTIAMFERQRPIGDDIVQPQDLLNLPQFSAVAKTLPTNNAHFGKPVSYLGIPDHRAH